MDFNLSKPQRLLKESAREFLARECGPGRVRALMETETAHDEKLWQAMAEQGWLGLVVAEEYGGLGLGLVELAVVAEEMGRACLPGAFLSTLTAAKSPVARAPGQHPRHVQRCARQPRRRCRPRALQAGVALRPPVTAFAARPPLVRAP